MTDLTAQIVELQTFHKGLKKTEEREREIVLSGPLPFDAEPDGLEPIIDSFDIEMLIPDPYPGMLPWVRETSGKIDSDYEHVFTDETLCLGVPIEMRRIFCQQPSLLGFVNTLVIPYFYGYCYWKKYGEHPFGEQKHGGEGVVEYYADKLNLTDEVTALAFVCFLYEHGYRGHHDCPCGSGRRVRKCHGPTLLDLHRHHTPLTLHHDLYSALCYYAGKLKDEQIILPKTLTVQIHRILNRRKH